MFILNVVKVAEAIVGFINPFEMEQKDKLYCISYGASATSEIERLQYYMELE
jgi:hypothetical protein